MTHDPLPGITVELSHSEILDSPLIHRSTGFSEATSRMFEAMGLGELADYDREIAAKRRQEIRHQEVFVAANAHHAEGRHAEAMQGYASIIQENPGYPNVFVHAGNVARDMGMDEQALYLYRHAMNLANSGVAEWPAIHFNVATALRNAGRFEEAKRHAFVAVAADPDDEGITMGAYISALQTEDFERGWEWYRKRKHRGEQVPSITAREWDGARLTPNEHLLLWLEQGVGEEILFASMLREAQAAAGCHVTLMCDPRLVPLFTRSFPGVSVAHTVQYRHGIYHLPIGNLPIFYRKTREDFPAPKAYLKAEPLRTAQLRARYSGGPKTLNVGLSWKSTNSQVWDYKSIPFSDLKPLFETEGCNFVSLQYGDVEEEKGLGSPVLFDPQVDAKADIDGAASQIDAMDIVITSSSAAAHIAGALGKETWVILSSGKGLMWHWFTEREDSLWYPNVRVFRQLPGEKGWGPVVARVKKALDDTRRQA